MVAVPVHMVAVPWGKRPFFFGAPSARAFGAGLRPGLPPPLVSYHLCNYRRPAFIYALWFEHVRNRPIYSTLQSTHTGRRGTLQHCEVQGKVQGFAQSPGWLNWLEGGCVIYRVSPKPSVLSTGRVSLCSVRSAFYLYIKYRWVSPKPRYLR